MLKSPVYPNPEADKEHHEFTYSIYPHRGSWKEAGTVARAYEFNNPEYSFLRVDQENVGIETAKMAEQGEELIVRLYECCNKRSRVVLTCGEPLAEASECNLMEEKDIPAEYTEHTVVFDMKPYEIKTIKIRKM